MSDIKTFKLFSNDNEKSKKIEDIVRNAMLENQFYESDKFDLGIAIGGDGSFLRMVKNSNFDSNTHYIGINSGTLGFMQEVNIEDIALFITELKLRKYKVEQIGVQQTTINYGSFSSKFYSLNEIVIRDQNLKAVRLKININDDLLEKYTGDGILISTSHGSTAHNLSYGGSIVYNTFSSLQITPMGPINSKVYSSLVNSVIIPDKIKVSIIPEISHRDLIITIDGENNNYKDVINIDTKIDDKTIKCLRLSHYNFPQRINEKFLSK